MNNILIDKDKDNRLGKNEVSIKDNKKLLRLPYYKQEKLYKKEEKKMRNPNKLKKKGEEEFSAINCDQVNANHKHLPKELKKVSDEIRFKPSEVGNQLNLLKYGVNEIKQKKIKLSRKQKKLQQPENTLASFMTKKEKNNLYGGNSNFNNSNFNKNQSTVEKNYNRDYPNKSTTNVTNDKSLINNSNILNNLNNNNSNSNNNNINNSNLNLNSTNNLIFVGNSANTNSNKGNLEMIGKKRKRLNKFKKAVYRYRFEKKQFIVDNIFNINENKEEKETQNENKEEKVTQNEKTEPELNKDLDRPINKEKLDKVVSPNNIDNNLLQNSFYNQNSYFNYLNNFSTVQPQQFFYYNMTYRNNYDWYNKFNQYNNINNCVSPYPNLYQNFYQSQIYHPPQYYNQHIVNNSNKFNLKNDTSYINKYNNKAKETKTKPTGFLFESTIKSNNNCKNEDYINYLKSTHNLNKNIKNLQGQEFNNSIQNADLKKINLKSLNKIADGDLVKRYVDKFEGVSKDSNINKKIIREYVDQILDKELDKKFSEFIEKMRLIYYKKKQSTPLKAKRRYVVGMREIEKFIRLDEVKCIFIVPNIEKVEGENSLDDRLQKIFMECNTKNIPKFFGLNKFKLGKLARNKHSSVSMVAFINVEGFEREFNDLIAYGENFKKMFYNKHKNDKEILKENKFINLNLFDVYNRE